MSELVLRARDLHKVFEKKDSKLHIVKGVSFDLLKGDCVAIMGASGAGKSTLLHLLGGLDRPTSGEIFFGQKLVNLWKLSDEEISSFRNENLGFIFQFHYLLPEFSALENVMMPLLIAGVSREAAAAKAKELLVYVGLSDRMEHRPAELSGGEQQRVAIARSVVMRPKLILADEMTGNLDSENGRRVIDLLLNLNREFGISILLVTHDHQVASRMKRVITMKDGKIQSS